MVPVVKLIQRRVWFRWSNSEDGTGNLGEVSGSEEANVTQFLNATDVLSTLSTMMGSAVLYYLALGLHLCLWMRGS